MDERFVCETVTLYALQQIFETEDRWATCAWVCVNSGNVKTQFVLEDVEHFPSNYVEIIREPTIVTIARSTRTPYFR